ncbi:hypothetical protein KKC60_05000 [Patescibacteria group bacterium]|nr:hypothetical protein [Patescibacteria group bacterium]
MDLSRPRSPEASSGVASEKNEEVVDDSSKQKEEFLLPKEEMRLVGHEEIKMPEGATLREFTSAPESDNRPLYLLERGESEYSILFSGQESETILGSRCSEIIMSEDGEQYLLPASDKEADSILLINGKKTKSHKNISEHYLSPDGRFYGYVSEDIMNDQGEEQRRHSSVWINGEEVSSEYYDAYDLVFFENGIKHAFIGTKTNKNGDKFYALVKDGQEIGGERENYVHSLKFTPDGKHYSFIERKYLGQGYPELFIERLAIDGQLSGEEYEEILDIALADNGKSCLCKVLTNERKCVFVHDGIKDKEYSSQAVHNPPDPLLFTNGTEYAYTAVKGKNEYVFVYCGKEVLESSSIRDPFISEDGQLYSALFEKTISKKETESKLMINGEVMQGECRFFSGDEKTNSYIYLSEEGDSKNFIFSGEKGPDIEISKDFNPEERIIVVSNDCDTVVYLDSLRSEAGSNEKSYLCLCTKDHFEKIEIPPSDSTYQIYFSNDQSEVNVHTYNKEKRMLEKFVYSIKDDGVARWQKELEEGLF